ERARPHLDALWRSRRPVDRLAPRRGDPDHAAPAASAFVGRGRGRPRQGLLVVGRVRGRWEAYEHESPGFAHVKTRTVVVDDERPARDRIKRFLAEHTDFEVVGEAGDGESAIQVIEELRPDLVFLDVRMPEADGFEVLRRLSYVPRVVFATAYERYAVQAFEVHSIDYLLKPFDRKRFGATLARVRQEMRKRVPAEENPGAR